MKRASRLFTKTMILAFCLFGVIANMTSGTAAYILHSRMTDEFISKGTAIARSIADASQEIVLNRDAATLQAMTDQFLEIEGVSYVYVLDAERTAVAHTFVPVMPEELRGLQEERERTVVTELEVGGYGGIIDISAPILAGVAGYVHVGMSRDLIVSYFWSAVIKLQGLLFFIFWGCVALLYYFSRRISRPLRELTEYAERLSRHDFSGDIDIRSNDEVGLLGRTMQAMAHELSVLFSEMEEEVNRSTTDLRESMSYLRAIIDNLADGLLVVGPAGDIALINPAIRDCFDLETGDFTGKPVGSVFPPEVEALARHVLSRDPVAHAAELPLSRSRTGKAVGTIIQTDEGEAPRCLGGVILIRDITKEKVLDRLKTEFISTVSHELRTPMTSVLGFAKIIRKKLDQSVFPAVVGDARASRASRRVRENLDIIVTEAERLTELINDVLDIAKMESGRAQWRDQIVDMGEVVRQAVDSTQGLWSAKELQVVCEVEPDLPHVRGDKARLMQVVVNLLSNAVKFTEASPIVCRVFRKGDRIVTSVEDKGIGIAEKDMASIFDKFRQAGDTLTEKPSGTGLGLPISRQIVEHHRGEIRVESEPEKGSRFFFSLPVMFISSLDDLPADEKVVCGDEEQVRAIERKAMLVEEKRDQDSAPLVLVVDDDPSLGALLTQILEGEGFRVRVAVNGEQALALAKELLPNLITMDLMLPGMDGRTAITCLRRNPFTRHIPILVLSALSDAMEAGGDVALVKPVDDVRLVEVVRALLLEKDMRRSCMILGEEDRDYCYEELKVICPGTITFCPPGQIWGRIEQGFRGMVFVPAEVSSGMDLERLARTPEVEVVILPGTTVSADLT
ncbi:ATP-binding protein [Pseudodesulfovibrio tunisiensis]|uniref:ATP-binding protein n=1 Tax=Pseudodesulfovibrio tunisiensis TaxID=463192 RepID=UPI001FB2EC08|nr:ATP-binding protein [Pseudodesulfovibrio tunisiensis]